jgi:hypothetical protein
MKAISQWGYFDGTTTHPVLKDTAQPTTAESEAIKEWECKDVIAGCLLSFRLPTWLMLTMDDYPTSKAQWDWLTRMYDQPALEITTEKELTSKPPAATARGSGHRRQCRGKCHACREEGHSTHDCCAPKEELMAVPAAEEPSGAAEHPETSPMNATYAANLEGEGYLSRALTKNLHTQTRGAEPEAISGEPGAIRFGQPGDLNGNNPKGVTHWEPDSIPGGDSHQNANVPVHPVGTGPDVLLEEDGTAGKNASIEGDEVPHVELQEPRVRHLTTAEENKFLTSSPSPITSEAASMQHSLAINTMMPGILEPDHGVDLDPSPHDTPPPITSEAARMQCSPDVITGTPVITYPEGSTDLVLLPPPWLPDEAVEPPIHWLPKLI